jgi:hypothetical protein
VEAGLTLFQDLEPPIAHAVAALIHKLHSAHPKPATQPTTRLSSDPLATGIAPVSDKPDLSSTSLDPDSPYTTQN